MTEAQWTFCDVAGGVIATLFVAYAVLLMAHLKPTLDGEEVPDDFPDSSRLRLRRKYKSSALLGLLTIILAIITLTWLMFVMLLAASVTDPLPPYVFPITGSVSALSVLLLSSRVLQPTLGSLVFTEKLRLAGMEERRARMEQHRQRRNKVAVEQEPREQATQDEAAETISTEDLPPLPPGITL